MEENNNNTLEKSNLSNLENSQFLYSDINNQISNIDQQNYQNLLQGYKGQNYQKNKKYHFEYSELPKDIKDNNSSRLKNKSFNDDMSEFTFGQRSNQNSIALDSSLIVIVTVKKISLIDYDRDEKKNFIINRDFQYLIESTTDIETNRPINIRIPLDDLKRLSFIDYQLLMKGDELNNIVHINDLNIIISLESMLRMYQFSIVLSG